jgi:hypothetical protein
MPRITTFDLITDTGHFTPLQLQPRALLAISFNAMSQWLREHLVSFPRLIKEHRFSVVILGVNLKYEAPLGFFDGDSVRVQASMKVLRAGSRAQLDVEFIGATGRAATVRILLCPVEVIDPISLAATPGKFEGEILARFQPDEIDPASPQRTLPELKSQLEKEGQKLGEHHSPFVVYRHLCEVADQWAFLEVPTLVGASREKMALEQGERSPELRDGLGLPLQSFDMELTRPYFWFQPGAVETIAYRHQGRLSLVHRLLSSVAGEEQHGVIVERF